MIGYVTLGTGDIERAAGFYDKIAAELGGARIMEGDNFIAWGTAGGASLGVIKPYDGKPASVGNGVMVALNATDKGQVDRVYKLAMLLGAKDEGAAGPRGDTFYAAYFRDLDGNKLNIFYMGKS